MQGNLSNRARSDTALTTRSFQAVSHEEAPSFPCADGALKIFDLPRPRRGENVR